MFEYSLFLRCFININIWKISIFYIQFYLYNNQDLDCTICQSVYLWFRECESLIELRRFIELPIAKLFVLKPNDLVLKKLLNELRLLSFIKNCFNTYLFKFQIKEIFYCSNKTNRPRSYEYPTRSVLVCCYLRKNWTKLYCYFPFPDQVVLWIVCGSTKFHSLHSLFFHNNSI